MEEATHTPSGTNKFALEGHFGEGFIKKSVCNSVRHIRLLQKDVQGHNFVHTITQLGFCTSHYVLIYQEKPTNALILSVF
jgi:hypothetical protein